MGKSKVAPINTMKNTSRKARPVKCDADLIKHGSKGNLRLCRFRDVPTCPK
jgi:hypothetical protein